MLCTTLSHVTYFPQPFRYIRLFTFSCQLTKVILTFSNMVQTFFILCFLIFKSISVSLVHNLFHIVHSNCKFVAPHGKKKIQTKCRNFQERLHFLRFRYATLLTFRSVYCLHSLTGGSHIGFSQLRLWQL
jgi:hypothetical protein